MIENSRDVQQMRGLGAELLRAHRHGDQAAFLTAMRQAERRVPGLLVSLCFVANKAMDQAITRPAADALVARVARDAPAPPPREEVAADAWRDAIAMIEAVARDDAASARVIALNTPDYTILLGCVLRLVSLLCQIIDPDTLAAAMAAARASGPPAV
jgi:hypothetical protein